MKKFIYPLILSFFIVFLTTSCDEGGGVEVKDISAVKITGFRESVLKLDVGLLIDNQSKRVVVVRGLKAQVLFGDEEAGKISVTKKIRIVAEAEEEYRVPVEIELQDLGKLSRALFYPSANGKKKAFHLRGVLKIRSGILCKRIPFDEKKVVRMF